MNNPNIIMRKYHNAYFLLVLDIWNETFEVNGPLALTPCYTLSKRCVQKSKVIAHLLGITG